MTYEEIIQFHGHECPGLAMGYRMATAAMTRLDSIRAEDEEIVAIVENDALINWMGSLPAFHALSNNKR